MQDAADRDRGDGDRREDLRAMVDQPGELVPVTALVAAWWIAARPSTPAQWSCRQAWQRALELKSVERRRSTRRTCGSRTSHDRR